MKKYLINFITLSSLIICSVILAGQVFAQEEATYAANIQYPVAELGNCEDEAACRAFCDKPDNKEICFDFAEKNNLMTKKEIEKAKNFLEIGEEGPGGCKGQEQCEAYCSNTDHIEECITFAEEHNIIPPEELEEAKKVREVIRRGIKPPPCGGKEKCDAYCQEPEHMEECITFGIEAGFLQGKELEDAQKMLQAVKRGVKPPPCKGKQACDEYCGDPEHMEECMTFAMEAGFMTEQEKADSQKMLEALKKGVRPPNCRGKEECDVYCQQEEHMEECMNFAEAAGFMTPEEAGMARKTGGKGPGGCRGKEECEAFCNNPDNQETCFNFGKEHGLIPEEDLKMMEEGKQRLQESLNQAPPEVMDCLNSTLGSDMMEKIKSGNVMPRREFGDQMRQCFEKMGPMGPPPGEETPGEGGIIPPTGQQGQPGPGGCQTPEECNAYCQNNPEQCKGFQPPANQMPCQGEQCQQQPPPCEGENCQQGPPPPEGQMPPEGQQPPIQQVPPPEQQSPPPSETPPPSSESSVPGSLFQAIIQFFTNIFR